MNKIICIIIVIAFIIIAAMFIKTFIDINSNKYLFALSDNVDVPNNAALERFSGGLKIRTISNPVYKDTDFSKFNEFISYLQEKYPLVFYKCDVKYINNYNIVIKLRGRNPELKPNLLTAHYDVVGVKDESKWQKPPFDGYYDEEKIIARGTIDDKGSVFAILEALNDLIENDFQPQADLYVAFSQAEETGSVEGAPKTIEYFKKNNISFNTALDEGGRIVNKNGKYYAFVGIAEKGRLLSKITVYGKGSHASSPANDLATKKLAKLMLAFNSNSMKPVMSKEIASYYKQTYDSYDFWTKFLLSNKTLLRPLLNWKLSQLPEDNARIHSTTAVTVIEASIIQNAVSKDASMLIDSRILPGQSTNDIKEYISGMVRKILPKEKVDIEYLNHMEPCPSSNIESNEYEQLTKNINNLYNGIIVAPYLTLGATDAREYAEISDNTYRFLPCVLTPDEAALMHSDNEFITIKNWARMIAFYKEFIMDR